MADQSRDGLQPQGTTSPAKGPSQDEMNGAGPEAKGQSEKTVNGHSGESVAMAAVQDVAEEAKTSNIANAEETSNTTVSPDSSSEAGIAESKTNRGQAAGTGTGSSLITAASGSTPETTLIWEALTRSLLAMDNLQKTTEKVLKNFEKLAAQLVEKHEQTNDHLEELTKEIRKRNRVSLSDKNEEKFINPNKTVENSIIECTEKYQLSVYPELDALYEDVATHTPGKDLHQKCQREPFGGVEHYSDSKGLGPFIEDPRSVPHPVDDGHDGYCDPSDEEDPHDDKLQRHPSDMPLNADRARDNDNQPMTGKRVTFSGGEKQSLSNKEADKQTTASRSLKDTMPRSAPDSLNNAENAVKSQPATKAEAPKTLAQSSRNQTESAPRDARPKELPTATVGSVHALQTGFHSDRSERGSRNRDRTRVSALGLSIFSSGETESRRLHEALERARAPDPDPASKARSFDTVLCLDTSESMLQGGAFEQMKKAAMAFVNGVEDVVNESGVEENIGIVMFGGYSNIVQHLTNDFGRVRDRIESMEVGGKSPFFEAMVVCLAAFDGRGGTVSVSGEYDVHPRIIFITDGNITECSSDPYGPDRVHDATNTRAGFSRLMMDLSPKTNSNMPHPILFVPVGSRADRSFLESMAKLNDSHLVEPEEITTLCNYFKVQETIGKVIVCLHNKETDSSDGEIEAVVKALVPDINSHEMTEVLTTVRKELKEPTRQKSQRTRPTDFDDVFEDTEGVQRGERLRLGTRVLRGPDWSWGDQDGRGAGTVVQHENKRHPFTWVLWDTGEWNRYPFGSEMGYHVWATDKHPVLKSENGELEIGMIVRKGSKWNQSPRDATLGVVIRKSRRNKKVKVRWDSGEITACPDDAVEFNTSKSGFSSSRETKSETTRVSPIPEENFQSDEEEDESKVRAWQWRDDWGNWHLYSEHQNEQLEKSYQRKKTGTCIIQRDGKQFRVLFGRKVERDLSKKLERDIQRVLLSPDDYASFLKAEELVPSDSMH